MVAVLIDNYMSICNLYSLIYSSQNKLKPIENKNGKEICETYAQQNQAR